MNNVNDIGIDQWTMYITQQLINGVDYAYNREQDVIDLFLTCVKFGADDSSSNL